MPGKQVGSAGGGRQIPGRVDEPEKRGETPLPDGPAIKDRITPERLSAGITTPGKCASRLGFGLGLVLVYSLVRLGWWGNHVLEDELRDLHLCCELYREWSDVVDLEVEPALEPGDHRGCGDMHR